MNSANNLINGLLIMRKIALNIPMPISHYCIIDEILNKIHDINKWLKK